MLMRLLKTNKTAPERAFTSFLGEGDIVRAVVIQRNATRPVHQHFTPHFDTLTHDK